MDTYRYEHVYVDGTVMHVFNSSFWLIHNFDNNLYYDPLTVNHLFIFIMSRVVNENKVQLDLTFRKTHQKCVDTVAFLFMKN